MGAWKRNRKRTPLVALVSAILFPLLLASASVSAAQTTRASVSRIHRVFPGSGTIQAAIDEASDGDLVLLGPGVYRERIDLLGKALCLRGLEGANRTLIDGAPMTPDGPRGSTVMMRSGETCRTRLEGLSIAGGTGTGTKRTSTLGGGLFLKGASPVIEDCLILNNTASRGGAVYSEDGQPSFINCWFYLNQSQAGGATIHCVRSRPDVVSCGFHEDGIEWVDSWPISIGSLACHEGACCLHQACIMASRQACDLAGGSWHEQRRCDDGVCPATCRGDVNGDHRVNLTDVLMLLEQWGMCS